VGNRSSLSATIGGVKDFLTGYSYDTLSRLDEIDQQGQTGGNAVAMKSLYFGLDFRPSGGGARIGRVFMGSPPVNWRSALGLPPEYSRIRLRGAQRESGRAGEPLTAVACDETDAGLLPVFCQPRHFFRNGIGCVDRNAKRDDTHTFRTAAVRR
jgi:hypothetical protein